MQCRRNCAVSGALWLLALPRLLRPAFCFLGPCAARHRLTWPKAWRVRRSARCIQVRLLSRLGLAHGYHFHCGHLCRCCLQKRFWVLNPPEPSLAPPYPPPSWLVLGGEQELSHKRDNQGATPIKCCTMRHAMVNYTCARGDWSVAAFLARPSPACFPVCP